MREEWLEASVQGVRGVCSLLETWKLDDALQYTAYTGYLWRVRNMTPVSGIN